MTHGERCLLLLALTTALSGCEGLQSSLQPSGPAAREIAYLWWGMFWAGSAIFALVLAMLLYAALRAPERRPRLRNRVVVAGGIVLPVVTLSILLPFGVNVSSGVNASLPDDAVTIRVTARQWWWDIEYDFGDTPSQSFTTANELYLPVSEPVELILTSRDVIHSLWLPRLAGKLDLIPGQINRMVIEADEPGTFRGQCAEFCGVAHSQMAFYAVAVPREEFARWIEGQHAGAAAPHNDTVAAGKHAFDASGCSVCHTVRGGDAWGRRGPDLTHVGSRKTIAAGTLANTPENLALWIVSNNEMKPGNKMPEFPHLDRDTRRAIALYLESLK